MIPDLFARLGSDPIALLALGAMVVWQACLCLWLRRNIWSVLKRQEGALMRAISRLQDIGEGEVAAALEREHWPEEVRRGLRAAFPQDEFEEPVEPRYALAPERLLPRGYNERLDTAAPGMFTASGILGTFLGLLLAFLRLDFQDPARSIAPLMTGMSIAFINSLLGVLLSIVWTLGSRKTRHQFDSTARKLAALVEEKRASLGKTTYGARLLRTLVETRVAHEESTRRLTEEIRELRAATSGASRELLESLAPKLEESFRALVNLPFERLTKSVDDFRDVVNAVAERSERTLAALDASIESVRLSQEGLERVTRAASASAEAFHEGVETLREGTEAAGAVVAEARRAAESLTASSETFVDVARRQELLAGSLDRTIAELDSASSTIAGAAEDFARGGDRLEAAAARIGKETIDSTNSLLESVRAEVEAAVAAMTASLTQFGDRTVAAYDESSAKLIENLDARVSDLTDRLSAELQTLAARLPEAASDITRSAAVLRKQLDKAVRGLEQAVKQLDVSSSQSLKARLEEYDKLVAQAVDHFSGTLLTWNGKLEELNEVTRTWGMAVTDFQRESSVTLQNTHASVAAAASAAAAAAKAAEAIQSTIGHLATIGGGVPRPPVGVATISSSVGMTEARTQEQT